MHALHCIYTFRSTVLIKSNWSVDRAMPGSTRIEFEFTHMECLAHHQNQWTATSLAESQKGVNAFLRCSVENQKGAIAIDYVQQ